MEGNDGKDFLTEPEDQYYIEEITPEVQEGWTTRTDEAVDEAEPYLPPTDPPLLHSSNQGADIATGFGTSPEDEPYRADAPTGDAWLQEEVQRVLAEDSSTANLPLTVNVEDGVVYLHGFVTDVADAEMAESVAGLVPGVQSVEDRTQVNPDLVEHSIQDFANPDSEP